MKGGIYSDQKCFCKKSFKDNGVDGLVCPDHPDERATRFKAKFGELCNRFDTYLEARRRLEAWRQEVDDGVFDIRLHKTDSPLYLDAVIEEFLQAKEKLIERGKITRDTLRLYRTRLMRSYNFFGRIMVGDVTYALIHKWLYADTGSMKTVHDAYAILREMLVWADHMGYCPHPRFPTWDFNPDEDMARRKYLTKGEQIAVLNQVYENEWATTPRKYIGIKWLATYFNVRPGELIGIKEKDLNRKTGVVTVREHKTSRRNPKEFTLTPDDLRVINSLPTGFPEAYLFRHDRSGHGVRAGQRFGRKALLKAWKKACSMLGIEGVDLYGGTRHTTIMALHEEEGYSPEEIRGGSEHKTLRAYGRYFQTTREGKQKIHTAADPGFAGQLQGQAKCN